jgi:nicotinamide-nucleotide amidase
MTELLIATEIGNLLRRKKLTLGTIESATGGLISHIITNVSGSSDYYKGSIISYSNEIKIKIIGVDADIIEKHGAVSEQVAGQMASRGRKLLGVDICLADTGIAGPGGASLNKPVGLFYLGISMLEGTYSKKYVFAGNREENKLAAALASLELLKEHLEK